MLFLIELGRWQFKIERMEDTNPSPPDVEYIPQPMQVHTTDHVGFLPSQHED